MPNYSAVLTVEAPARLLRWEPGPSAAAFSGTDLVAAAAEVRDAVHVLRDPDTGGLGLGTGGIAVPVDRLGAGDLESVASLPPLYPEWLGSRGFCERHGLRFPYLAGAMANGIASVELVIAMAEIGAMGFFGAAGLSLGRVETAILTLKSRLGNDRPWGVNLIHSPAEPGHEAAVADLLIRHGVRCVEASAYMALTAPIVRYAASGLRERPDGSIERAHRVVGKISREEVARHFLQPAPAKLLAELFARGEITAEEARLAERVPVATDITCEADSGGHTDNRPLTALLPSILLLRDRIVAERGYVEPIHVGAAGGLGTPSSLGAAFALGADFVQTGSINQGCVESGLHASGRAKLAQVGMADVTMAPAADMFEMGVEVQVLKRGSLFAPRARKLYELYRSHASLEDIPAAEREKVEQTMLRASFDEAWASTRSFWMSRDPAQVERAERDAKHRMALVFRAYLGLSSRWAIDGVAERDSDYQIWCGPAMGAFNRWVEGSFLEAPEQRRAGQVALNLLEGAAVVARAQQLRSYGLPVPAACFDFRPRPLA